MSDVRRIKSVVYLPLTYNDGTQVAESVFEEILDEVYVAFGGYTDKGTVDGAYPMANGTSTTAQARVNLSCDRNS